MRRAIQRLFTRLLAGAGIMTIILLPLPAQAWTRPGHMVTAAIAWRELKASDPALLDELVAILAQHPDVGPFQVAIGREEGEAKAFRLFLEAVRWPDDIRTGPQDHPVWHHQLQPYVATPGIRSGYARRGAAYEALALQETILAYPKAAPAERAVALCWVMHILGDMHQPLHSAERYSDHWPEGDEGGSQVYVLDPETNKPINLHWFWDDSVNRSADPEVALHLADEFMKRYPRTQFAAALTGNISDANAVNRWATESRDLARSLTYRADAPDAHTPQEARPAAPAYLADVRTAAAQRVTLAGYRMADLLRALLRH